MSSFFANPWVSTIWAFLNSQFLATAVGAIVAVVIAKHGAKTVAATTDAAVAQEASNALQKAHNMAEPVAPTSTTPPPVQSSTLRDYRAETRGIVEQAKGFVDKAVKNDPDGRHQRTYDYIGRSDFVALAVALNERKRLTSEQLEAAAALFSEWKLYERGRAASKVVTQASFEKIRDALEKMRG
jgi:hypothetical protein